jgi:hypothetical protein
MTLKELIDNHIFYDDIDDKVYLRDITIRNVMVGKEAIDLAPYFSLTGSPLLNKSSTTLGLGLQSITEHEYITFTNNRAGSSIKITASPAHQTSDYRDNHVFVYYADVAKALQELHMLYPYVKDINMEKITSNDLYETLGMEKI